MVVFTCNNCGDSVKKPKVDRHISMECRKKGPVSLCCIDCLKDFKGDAYMEHTKCVTEAERYSGKNFVPKSSSNKGERKQNSWVDTVRSVLNQPSLNQKQKQLLEAVANFDNVPRKKAKFQNFVRCSIRHIKVQSDTIDCVFDLLDKEFKSSVSNMNNSQNGSQNLENKTLTEENVQKTGSVTNGKQENGDIDENTCTLTSNDSEKSQKKKKKKKKKKNDSDQENVQEISDPNLTKSEEEIKTDVDMEAIEENVQTDSSNNGYKKKNKRKRKLEADETSSLPKSKEPKYASDVVIETKDESNEVEEFSNESTRFCWESIIKSIFEKCPQKEISTGKFTKKVVKEYQNYFSSNKSSEEIMKKCFRKIKKIPCIEVQDKKIKLTV